MYLARQQLEMNNRGTALCWALKARDAEICSKIAEYELECFHSTETWSIPALVDAMENNSNNIYSEKLLFLSKYKQVSNKNHSVCAISMVIWSKFRIGAE